MNVSLRSLLISISVVAILYLLNTPRVFAAACSGVPISGNYTVSSSCEFSGTDNGVDAGTGTSNTANITINSSQTLTISAGQTVAFGGSITINGSLSIVNTGQIRQLPLWMTDADSDNYPSSTTQIVQSTQPTNGRRRNLMTSITNTDCSDSVSGNCASNLSATVVSATQIDLSWTTGNASTYDVERCSGAGCSSFATYAGSTGLTGITHSNTSLTCATVYRYRILAKDSSGTSIGLSSATSDTTTSACAGPVTYSENFTSGQTPGAQCTAWGTFLSSIDANTTYNTITIKGSNDETGRVCTGASANTICQNLRTLTTSVAISCGGWSWKTGPCQVGGGPGNNIELSANGSTCACSNPGYIARPCIGNTNWGGINGATCSAPTQRIDVVCEP